MAVGLTVVEPLADVEVNAPGVMAMLVAPFVTQLSVLLEPELMLVGIAVNEVIVGALTGTATFTVTVAAIEPAAFIAESV